ncbi:MAG: hypothetical protein ACRDRW_15065 [Pseudonocardiaceae bacterium]
MDAMTPALIDAYTLLDADLVEHLGEAEFLGTKVAEWSGEDVANARKLISDLVVILRGLMVEHEMRPQGTCRTCSSLWPCPVATTIHAMVKDPNRAFIELVARAHDAE